MFSFVCPVNSSYNYVKKVKLLLTQISEMIDLQDNGGSGGNQTQIPNCHFYIGIAGKW